MLVIVIVLVIETTEHDHDHERDSGTSVPYRASIRKQRGPGSAPGPLERATRVSPLSGGDRRRSCYRRGRSRRWPSDRDRSGARREGRFRAWFFLRIEQPWDRSGLEQRPRLARGLARSVSLAPCATRATAFSRSAALRLRTSATRSKEAGSRVTVAQRVRGALRHTRKPTSTSPAPGSNLFRTEARQPRLSSRQPPPRRTRIDSVFGAGTSSPE